MDALPLSTIANGKWIVDFTPRRQPGINLLCLPYAGGGANLYRRWAAALPEWMGVLAVQLPGRETRIAEPPMTSLPDLVEQVTDALLPSVGSAPLALFGHSMGAMLAYEVARNLRARGMAEPAVLLLAGRRAPGWPGPTRTLHDLPDAEFRRALARLGGTPPEVLASDELMELVLPVLRADFKLVETWRLEPSAPLSCPVVTFAGAEDVETPPEFLTGWAGVTTGPSSHHILDGGHFFLDESRAPLLDLIRSEMENRVGPLSGQSGSSPKISAR